MAPTKAAGTTKRAATRIPPTPLTDDDEFDDLDSDELSAEVEQMMEEAEPDAADFGDLPAYGEITDDDELPDLTPLPYKILGYRTTVDDDGNRSIDFDQPPKPFIFRFRRTAPMGSMMNMLGAFGPDGEMDIAAICAFLTHSISKQDRRRWVTTLDNDDWFFKSDVLGEVGLSLAERYMGRPLGNRSARRRGARRTGTSSAARSRSPRARTSGR